MKMPSAFMLLGAMLVSACGPGGSSRRADDSAAAASNADSAARDSASRSPSSADAASEFRAVGNEPGWMLSITDSLTVLQWDYGERKASAATPPAQSIPNGRRYAVAGDSAFTVTVRDTLCADGMSGRQFPSRVQVSIGSRTLDGCGGDPAALLQGGEWEVDSLNGKPLVDGSPITITFGMDGRVNGAACNSFSATYAMKVEGIAMGPVNTTRRACPPAVNAQETAFLKLMYDVVPYEVSPDGALILGAGNRDGRLHARRR